MTTKIEIDKADVDISVDVPKADIALTKVTAKIAADGNTVQVQPAAKADVAVSVQKVTAEVKPASQVKVNIDLSGGPLTPIPVGAFSEFTISGPLDTVHTLPFPVFGGTDVVHLNTMRLSKSTPDYTIVGTTLTLGGGVDLTAGDCLSVDYTRV